MTFPRHTPNKADVTNLQVLREVLPVCVPRGKFLAEHHCQVVYEATTEEKEQPKFPQLQQGALLQHQTCCM